MENKTVVWDIKEIELISKKLCKLEKLICNYNFSKNYYSRLWLRLPCKISVWWKRKWKLSYKIIKYKNGRPQIYSLHIGPWNILYG